jgi:hypothetical protein
MIPEERHLRDLSMTSVDLLRVRSLQKLTRLCVVGMANNFNLGVGEDNVESLLWVFHGELAKEELLELGKKCVVEKEGREKETTGEGKEEPTKKLHSESLAEAFSVLNKLLKKFENMDPQHHDVSFMGK